jgi:hypothetical protein
MKDHSLCPTMLVHRPCSEPMYRFRFDSLARRRKSGGGIFTSAALRLPGLGGCVLFVGSAFRGLCAARGAQQCDENGYRDRIFYSLRQTLP